MMLTLLLIGGAAAAVTTAFVMTAQPYESTALAGEATAVGLADPASDTMTNGGHEGAGPVRTEWHVTTVSALCDAEDLLDCLEAHGFAERELIVLGNSSFAVRWR